MEPVSLFSDPAHYDPRHRGQLIDLLKPFWGKADNFTDAERVALYGISEKELRFVPDFASCTLALLPMSWNYYHAQGMLQKADAFVAEAAQAGKKVLSWTSGDFGVKVPNFDNLVVLRASGYRSKLPAYHHGMPVFFGDPLKSFYHREEIFLREKPGKPVVGFCGQAKGTPAKYALDVVRTVLRNARFYTGLSVENPQDIYPSTLRRARVLHTIEKDGRLIADFIKRDRYRAGVATPEARLHTTMEYYDNMIRSDYIVCVRGGGNFSVRLYETLAMGRIPVFVHTDCLLPLADQVDWKRHVVWVEEAHADRIGDIILDFHHGLNPTSFRSLQMENRRLWKEQMTLGQFFRIQMESCCD